MGYLGELKKIVRALNKKLEFDFTNSHNVSTQKKYLLAMPYRHDRISEEFSRTFFSSVKDIARKMNLGVIVKSHPNDIYDYRDYFSDQEEFFSTKTYPQGTFLLNFFCNLRKLNTR